MDPEAFAHEQVTSFLQRAFATEMVTVFYLALVAGTCVYAFIR